MTELTHVELEWVKGRVESWIRVGRNIGFDGGRSCARDSHHGSEAGATFRLERSESVPKGLYGVQPARRIIVTELVVVLPPEPLATFLANGGYLPRGVPLIKRILALPEQIVCRKTHDNRRRDCDGRGA